MNVEIATAAGELAKSANYECAATEAISFQSSSGQDKANILAQSQIYATLSVAAATRALVLAAGEALQAIEEA